MAAADTGRPAGLEWQAPPQATRESYKLGWLDDVVVEGQAWLRSQRGYSDFRKALDILSGTGAATPRAEYRSKVATNRLKRNCREVVGTCAKLRPIWGYHSDNAAYASRAEMMNKVTRAWYLESFADRSVKDSLFFAAGTCRGWIRPVSRRDMYGTGRGDIRLLTYGSPCVLPFQLPQNGDWQSAYAVTILEEMPVAMAHGMWPSKQHRLVPSSSRFWYANDAVRRSATGNWMQRAFSTFRRTTAPDSNLTDLLVPIRYTYIIDLSINTTKAEIPMGEPGSSWAYTVPYIGQDIPLGNDPRTGQIISRKATENDARLYPYRRLIISSDTTELYDGPSFDWHGMLPLVSFCLDEMPWEPLGFSLVHDGFELQKAIDETLRADMDKLRSSADMALVYDQNTVAMKDARSFDPMQPRARFGFDGSATETPPFQPAVPPEVLKVSAESMAVRQYLEQTMDNQMAIHDVQTLIKMRATGAGGAGDMEKILEANGPIIEDMSRSMEPPMRDLGRMVQYLVLQYYTTTRVMQYVGEDGVTPETFDYSPDSLIPSHISGENPEKPSSFSPRQRARIFADNLRFFILPHSLHEITQMAAKLGLIQLRKAGLMIDSQTIAEAWAVPNFGHLDGNTVIERWKSEQELQIEFAARMKELGGSLGLGQPPGGAGPGKKPEGRPPSGQAAPALKDKPTEGRSTITESK